MKKRQMLEKINTLSVKPILHSKLLEILFENRRLVKNIFFEIQGLFDIDYIGLKIINSNKEIIAFSTIPSIEFNLIHQNLWENDVCFIPPNEVRNEIIWWEFENEYSYELREKKQIKLLNNKLTSGFTICRDLNNFCLLFSYATKSKNKLLKEYYTANIYKIMDLGDYFLNSIIPMYNSYHFKDKLITSSNFKSKKSTHSNQSSLKLVINNK
ncbi:putative FlgJ-like protein (plasmid) [Legionella adelaidensis]|uniref:Putative FlgJ-like protein n=1 Tax=Legionella adelaidensis TaxID=45056 RepID=A0A0W0R3P4_9GAMM|nr:hypothetical protein [Legionella adelaidensis]KTC65684.1 putative FlgJ-like protein [Legionella adelaidensis]VEH85966.1 putative FlgJ-like protein [Legionella adelaidensis]